MRTIFSSLPHPVSPLPLPSRTKAEMDQELPPQLAAFLGGGTDPLVLGGIDASFQAVKHKNDIASKSSIAELLVGTKKASLKSNKKKEASIAKQTDVRAAAKVRTDKARRHQIANRNRGIGCGGHLLGAIDRGSPAIE